MAAVRLFESRGLAASNPRFQELFDQFKRYKETGDLQSGVFGKDALYLNPRAAQDVELRHVHIVESKRRGRRRTSDQHLVYVEGRDTAKICILAVFVENAHELAKSDKVMAPIIRAAERFRDQH